MDSNPDLKNRVTGLRYTWLLILACLAITLLACGLKNYLIVLVRGGPLCPYLCASLFSSGQESIPVLGALFELQQALQEQVQSIVNQILLDKWNLTTSLIITPVMEEAIYRGPLFLLRDYLQKRLWWILGIGLTLVFAYVHGRSGLAVMPLIVFGVCSLWLIAATRRFWPSITLHILHNFFFTSIILYQSIWAAD